MSNLPTDSRARKDLPLVRGLLDYFPAALADVARVSVLGNQKHNPGEELHHARGKSMDHADCIVRHLVDRGGFDAEGVRHSASAAWRMLALLQEELEAAGAPLARGAREPDPGRVGQDAPKRLSQPSRGATEELSKLARGDQYAQFLDPTNREFEKRPRQGISTEHTMREAADIQRFNESKDEYTDRRRWRNEAKLAEKRAFHPSDGMTPGAS